MILLVNIWVIFENERIILSAHCFGDKAGLAESCSHIASVLFYLEATTRIQASKYTAATGSQPAPHRRLRKKKWTREMDQLYAKLK